ncbi:MAG TPA: DNA polymerase III subunit beta [Prolixibacteraceae bacterium]|nr:DNA polymerase III subunit beta [Prolixibacteraceae bacterium]
MIQFIKEAIGDKIPEAKVYLFGSRNQDDANGGDIDLLILTPYLVDKKLFRTIRIEFYKKFGWQKIDLVNLTYDDQSVFRQLISANLAEL